MKRPSTASSDYMAIEDYIRTCKILGKEHLPEIGFITPRAIRNTTFLYGGIGGRIIPALTKDRIVFFRYDETVDKFSREPGEDIPLKHPLTSNARILHFDAGVEERNVFWLTFALMHENKGSLSLDLLKKRERFSMMRDLGTSIRKLRDNGMIYAYELERDVFNSNSESEISYTSFPLNIPFSDDYKYCGGNGTIIIYDAKDKSIVMLIEDGGKIESKKYELKIKSDTPSIEITARGVFVIMDDDRLVIIGDKTINVDLGNLGLDIDALLYELIFFKEGGNANLLIYSDSGKEGILVITDPTEEEFGTIKKFPF